MHIHVIERDIPFLTEDKIAFFYQWENAMKLEQKMHTN